MFFIALMFLTYGCAGYNLDVDNPAIITIDGTRYQGNPEDVRSCYFGFSLAGYKDDGKTWLLVGAPKATPSYSYRKTNRDIESGGLFACDVNSMTSSSQQIKCKEVIADDLKEKNDWKTWHRNRSHEFLGGSLTTPPSGEGIIVICGHREKFDLIKDKAVNMIGGCRQIPNLRTPGELIMYTWDQWNSVLGVSAEYAKDGSGVIFGVPQYRAGTMVEYGLNGNKFILSHTYKRPRSTGRTYGGYDVTTGKFQDSGQLLRVLGAPLWNSQGKVYLFPPKSNKPVIEVVPDEIQTGSYFGAKVCACDVDNDGRDELLVGAPLYKTNAMEAGRAYVFKFSNEKNGFTMETLISGKHARGRLGTMITCAGDLDNDGYKDVLIGAPYEPQGGAVYVYNGGKSGLADSSSQTLRPPSGQNIFSFGHSGSVLKNIMKDRASSQVLQQTKGVAIGAFQSNTVFMYKTRPVIYVQPRLSVPKTINVTPDILIAESKEILLSTVNISLIYLKAEMSEINITISVITDTLAVHTSMSKRVWSRDVTMQRGRSTKLEIPLYLMDRLLPFPYDFKVMVQYKLRRDTSLGSLEPILDRLRSTDLKAKSRIDLKCGDSEQCETDISLYGATFLGPEGTSLIVYKDTRTSTFEVGVRNGAHVARGVELTVILPENVRYQSATISGNFTKVSCLREGTEVKCMFNHYTPANVDTRIQFSLSLHKVPPVHDVTFNVSVTTLTSEAGRTENNNVTLSVPLDIKADIDVAGRATPNDVTVRFSREEYEKDALYHVSLVNQGPGAIPNVTWYLGITVPTTMNLVRTLNESHFGQCTSVRNKVNTSNEVSSSELCSSEQNMACLMYHCSAGELEKDSVQEATFKLKISSDVAKTLLMKSPDLRINFTVLVLGPESLDPNSNLRMYTKGQNQVRLVGWKDVGPNLLWVICGSTVGGGLFVALTALVLYKAGFFKREKKEEMQRLLRHTVIQGCDEDEIDDMDGLPPKAESSLYPELPSEKP